jgi:transposase-like protein
VQRRRNTTAAIKLMRKLLKKQGFAPKMLVTDKLRSYGAAKSELGLSARHEQGLRKNNRAENSHHRCDDASSRCKGSSRPAQLSDFCPFMPRSTTLSTPSVTSYPVKRFASSGARHLTSGGRLPRLEIVLACLCEPIKVPVMVWTAPARHLAQ